MTLPRVILLFDFRRLPTPSFRNSPTVPVVASFEWNLPSDTWESHGECAGARMGGRGGEKGTSGFTLPGGSFLVKLLHPLRILGRSNRHQ